MSMNHQAFAFDWQSFQKELLPIMEAALQQGNTELLARFVETNLDSCRAPYEGSPLTADWRRHLAESDVQELSDFALTKYYDPKDSHGLGIAWIEIDAGLPPELRPCLLGMTIGYSDNLFDPGLMGSYFQSPDDILHSLARLEPCGKEAVGEFIVFLAHLRAQRLGLYVTF